MRLLLIGNGGREHALAWKLCQSPHVAQLLVAPGNGGTATLPKTTNISIAAEELTGLVELARTERIDLTVVGPEAPLVAGIVDRFQAAGLRIFGPTEAAARLEGSKAFSKHFMRRYAIPTADAAMFTELEDALDFLEGLEAAPVIKASGLAAGKGVVLPATKEEASQVLRVMLVERQFGEASATVLIEERLAGPELSVLAFCDGVTARIMPPAQDHKRLLDADQGPNTGGMGAFAPSPLATPELLAEVERTVLQPTLAGMAAEGSPYVGVLYAGLMLTEAGPKVLEFNARFGDPETEVILPLLESDLVEVMLACCAGRLAEVDLDWRPGAAVTVVMASGGYPGSYPTGLPITGIEQAEAVGCIVFHAGTRVEQGRLLTAGGRVLAVTAAAADLPAAAARAYTGVAAIHFPDSHHRSDIAANLAPEI